MSKKILKIKCIVVVEAHFSKERRKGPMTRKSPTI